MSVSFTAASLPLSKGGHVCNVRSEARQDQEEVGELDSHEDVRLSFAGPGEIKRREVSWTLAKKLDFHLRVQARSRAGRRSLAQKVGLVFCFGCSSAAVPRTLPL